MKPTGNTTKVLRSFQLGGWQCSLMIGIRLVFGVSFDHDFDDKSTGWVLHLGPVSLLMWQNYEQTK